MADPEEAVADAVFAQAFIPRRLEEVVHFERDHARLQAGTDTEGIYFTSIAGGEEGWGVWAGGKRGRRAGSERRRRKLEGKSGWKGSVGAGPAGLASG